MNLRIREADVIYVCWRCGDDFVVAEHYGLTDDLEVACPLCGSDLVAVDITAVRRGRPDSRVSRRVPTPAKPPRA